MADDQKISEMTELLSGDLHDDIAFEVIDLTEAAVEDQNKRVKLVTLEASFGSEDKIFKDDTLVQAWGTGEDKVTFLMEEGDVGGVHQLFSVDGGASNIYLGRIADFHLRMGTGSDPSFRAVSGSDTWMSIDPDRQRLGSTAANNNRIEVDQGGNYFKAFIDDGETGVTQEVIDASGNDSIIYLGRQAALHVRIGIGSDPEIRIMSGTDEWFKVEADEQILGNTGSNTSLSVRQVVDEISGVVGGTELLKMVADSQILGNQTDTRIELAQAAGTIMAYINNALRFSMDPNIAKIGNQAGSRLEVDWGDDFDLKWYDSNGAQAFHVTENQIEIGKTDHTILEMWQGGSAYFQFRVNNIEELHLNGSGMALKDGARVNNIETTLTNDDTHIPTSGAVFGAIPDYSAGFPVGGTTYGDGLITDDGAFRITVNENSVLTIRDSNNDWLAAFYSNGANDFYHNNQNVFSTKSNGIDVKGNLNLGTGASVDTIETTLTNDDTHIPTSGAVVDAIAAISIPDADKIIEGNSSVEVIDAGTGQIDITVDATLVARFLDDNFFINMSATKFFDIAADNQILGNDATESINVNQSAATIRAYIAGATKLMVTGDGLQLKGDQTGGEAIGNAATTVAITFGTAHADANYQVLATVENTTDGGPLVLAAIITAKATTGFTATLSAATDSANYVLNWMVLRS